MGFTIPQFQCIWADYSHGVEVDNGGFTIIDVLKLDILLYLPNKLTSKSFYIDSCCDGNSNVVLQGKRWIVKESKM